MRAVLVGILPLEIRLAAEVRVVPMERVALEAPLQLVW